MDAGRIQLSKMRPMLGKVDSGDCRETWASRLACLALYLRVSMGSRFEIRIGKADTVVNGI